jgi:hypothetical protein
VHARSDVGLMQDLLVVTVVAAIVVVPLLLDAIATR